MKKRKKRTVSKTSETRSKRKSATKKSTRSGKKSRATSKATRTRTRTRKATSGKKKEVTRKKRKYEAPKGYEISPGVEGAHARIKERLHDTRDRLAGFDSRVYTHEYKSGEIDGEIAVKVPRGKTAVEVSQELEEAFQTKAFGLGRGGFWYALGVRLSIHKDEAEERSGSSRVRGMDDMMMHYRRITTPKLIDSFLREQKIMIPGAEKKYRRKTEIVYIRLHWNPNNEKPER